MRIAALALLAFLGGCMSPFSPSGAPGVEPKDFGLEVPVVFVVANATASEPWSGPAFNKIDGPGLPAYQLDFEARTVWFGAPDVLWQSCGAKAVFIINEERDSPVVHTVETRQVFQRKFATDFDIMGVAIGGRVLSNQTAEVKLRTASPFGDIKDIRTNTPGVQFTLDSTRNELGRTATNAYRSMDVQYHTRVAIQYLGTWSLKLDPVVAESYSDASHLREYYNDHAATKAAACDS